MIYMTIRMFIAGLFCISTILTSASSSDQYDLCGIDQISDENATITLNITESAMESPLECSRVILLQSKRVKLTVEELSVTNGAEFEIHDGPYAGQLIVPKNGSGSSSVYVSSGNAMFLLFKRGQSGKGAGSFRGKVSSLQTTCHCQGVKNGALECAENHRERKCEVRCQPSHMDLFTAKELRCDLVEGRWDIDVHNTPLSCQKVTPPQTVEMVVRFNYVNCTCQDLEPLANIEEVFRQYIANNSDIKGKGVCFSSDGKGNCSVKPLEASCAAGNPPQITVTIKDNIVTPSGLEEGNSKLQDLVAAYNNSLNLQGIVDSGALNITKGKATFAIAAASFVVGKVNPLCGDKMSYIKPPGNSSNFVCSTCPVHHVYNATTQTCQQCPTGSSAAEGAESCQQMNGTKTVPTKTPCSNKCMKGKQVDSKSWMCEWCPYDTYQNFLTKVNPKCISCPDQKKTPFPGAQDVSQCYDPCSSGTFLNISSGQCQACPKGTYLDSDKHAFVTCKTCDMGKLTWTAGSKEAGDCYSTCEPGQIYDVPSKSCSACPTGKYQNESNKDSCKDCPGDKTTLAIGSKAQSACISVCGPGKFRQNSTDTCEDCPKDSYQDQTQHTSTECKPCGVNKTTEMPGQSDISQCMYSCQKGWFLDKSVSEPECKKCLKGSYQDQQGQDQCKPCPDGKDTVSEGQTDESSCIATCSKGELFNATSKTCNACPYGSYQAAVGHLQEECSWCPDRKTTVKEGAQDASFCAETSCNSLPCQNGATCTDDGDNATCHCPEGISGTFCETIENKETFQNIKMSLKITSLTWSEELKDKNSVEYKQTKGRIEAAIRFEFRYDPSFKSVQVTDLRNGSVDADFDLYFSDEADYVPGKALQSAAYLGKVQNMTVSSLQIRHQDCTQPLGMENNRVKDNQITASTHFDIYEPSEGRLHAKGGRGWEAKFMTKEQYLQIDFQQKVNITAVATQGRPSDCFVTEYKISFSDDGKTWKEYTEDNKSKTFTGNEDSDSVERNNLPSAVTAHFIRFHPQAWNSSICMRVEAYGCLSDPLIPADERPSVKPTGDSGTPPVVSAVKKPRGGGWGVYLGITFGVLLVVGVVIAVVCWKRKSRMKKKAAAAKQDESLMPMGQHGDGAYRVIQKNADEPDDDDDENVV